MRMAIFNAVIQKDEKFFVATCPEVGTASQGRNIKEALENLKEATELYLEEFPQKRHPKVTLATFEVVGGSIA